MLPQGAIFRTNAAGVDIIGLSVSDYAAVGSEWQGVFFTDPSTLREFADFAALWTAVTAVKSFNAAHVMGVADQTVIIYPEGTAGTVLNRAYRALKMVYDTEMVLPQKIWGVVSRKTRIGVNNLLKNFLADPPYLSATGPGTLSKTEWTDTPTNTSDDGETISFVQSRQTASAEYNVAPLATPGGLSVLIVGDSTVYLAGFSGRVAALAAADGTPVLRFLGTQGTLPDRHEGYPGKDINWLHTHADSPFYSGSGFDAGYAAYCDANGAPDAVIIKMDVNDQWEDMTDAAVTNQINANMPHYDAVVDGILAKNPNTYIGIDIAGGPKSEAAIKSDYGDTYSAYRTRRNFAMHTAAKIARTWDANVDLLNGGLAVSIPDGFLNSLHPDESGYQEIAISYYAWLKNKVSATLNNLLGWHNSTFDAATRSTSQTNGTLSADIVRQVYFNSFAGIGVRRYHTEKRQYFLNVRFYPIEATTTNMFIGITLWNGTSAIAYDIPADKQGLLTTFLTYLNYVNRQVASGHFTIGAWNTFTTTIDLTGAPDFDSISIHVSGYKPAPTGTFDMVDIDLLETKLIPVT